MFAEGPWTSCHISAQKLDQHLNTAISWDLNMLNNSGGGSFLGVRCATILLHTFGTKLPENAILEHPIPF